MRTKIKGYTLQWLDLDGISIGLACCEGQIRVLMRHLAATLGLSPDSVRRTLQRYGDVWKAEYIDVGDRAELRHEPSIPLAWLDAYLWRLTDPVNIRTLGRINRVRREWRAAYLLAFAPTSEPDSPEVLAQAQHIVALRARDAGRIGELELEVAKLRAEREALKGDAFLQWGKQMALLQRDGRTLGPAEFEIIRDPGEAQVTDADMGRRHKCSREAIRQIRSGTYKAKAFGAWMHDKGLALGSPTEPNRIRALASWGPAPPEWVLALAKACDEASQGIVGRRLGVSGSLINQVLGASYKGRIDRIEEKVLVELSGSLSLKE